MRWFALQFIVVACVAIGLAALSSLYVGTDIATYLLAPFAGVGFVVALLVTKALSAMRY